jgi:hypothetical protein
MDHPQLILVTGATGYTFDPASGATAVLNAGAPRLVTGCELLQVRLLAWTSGWL